MKINELLEKIKDANGHVSFDDLIQVVSEYYVFKPTRFVNGDLVNEPGENNGSCKLFAFSKIHQLTEEQTLKCFGKYYQDVLKTPDGTDHLNIRNFMKTGWSGILIEGEPLAQK